MAQQQEEFFREIQEKEEQIQTLRQ